ncbi:hypothetical protein DXG01_004597 [Tephrocybe rancida]|nr:hypothetical protein DXG01_004597 [Tephrocybe rancida]
MTSAPPLEFTVPHFLSSDPLALYATGGNGRQDGHASGPSTLPPELEVTEFCQRMKALADKAERLPHGYLEDLVNYFLKDPSQAILISQSRIINIFIQQLFIEPPHLELLPRPQDQHDRTFPLGSVNSAPVDCLTGICYSLFAENGKDSAAIPLLLSTWPELWRWMRFLYAFHWMYPDEASVDVNQ